LFSVITTVISYAEVVTSRRHHCTRKVFFSNKVALKKKTQKILPEKKEKEVEKQWLKLVGLWEKKA